MVRIENPGWKAWSTLCSSVLLLLLGSALPSLAQIPASFRPALAFATGALPISVAIGDVNGDGIPDLIAVNTAANTVSVLFGTGDGSFGPKTDFPTGAVPHGVAVADLNGDGNLSIVVANTGADTVSVLLGNGTGSFGAATDFQTGAAPFFLAIGDLNRDGIPDLVVVNVNADTVSVLLGRGNGGFRAKTDFPTGAGAREVAIGDLNGDGVPDLVVANVSANTVSVLLGTGNGQFAPKTDFATGAGARAVAIGDVNGDGVLDVVVANANADTVSVLLGTGTGALGSKTDFATGAGPRAVAISDVNRDGKPDLVVPNFNANTVSVLLGIGNGTFTPKTDLSTGVGPFSLAIDDLNGDGKPDLLVGDVNANALTVFVNSAPADTLSGVENFVSGFYTKVLGRTAEPAGLAGWTNFLRANCNAQGFDTIARGFFDSLEFRTAKRVPLQGLVTLMYRTFLGRNPDPGGLAGWANLIRQARLTIALRGFIPSAEFQNLLPNRRDPTAVTAVVTRLYQQILRRAPEPAGLNGWVNYIVSTGDLEGATVGFLASQEFEARVLTFRDYVTILYRTFLGRDPEPAGLDGWEAVLRTTLLQVIDTGFVPSAEFQGLQPRVCG